MVSVSVKEIEHVKSFSHLHSNGAVILYSHEFQWPIGKENTVLGYVPKVEAAAVVIVALDAPYQQA